MADMKITVRSCANILVFSSAPAYSQQMAFLELWIDLSLRGHNVTLVTPNPVNNPKLTNLTEIDVKYSCGVLDNVTTIVEFFGEQLDFLWNTR
ncbi:hypothetical protein NQ318_021899 [Aromia moschata]|uniref:Uncharacterized protein n=1 Tax=Aromia moschata TaxID=1265417 RepID=A0AAV8Z6P4_9CUCU|nr:hypothetical protein NQ318_021899 [Aromia moschata]